MSTLYIRDVPEQVAATLRARAAARGQSLSAYVAHELAEWASRPTNDEILERLRDVNRDGNPRAEAIVEQIAADRR